ncbi:hypothetical protein ACFE04_026566 [Oxalis oulophora]
MLSGHNATEGLSKLRTNPDLNDDAAAAAASSSTTEEEEHEEILYKASFLQLSTDFMKYDTVIWLFISLLLILAWGIGILMLLYLPFKRYVLRIDIASRKLYVTATHIVYKVSRPSFIPFRGLVTIQTRVPLSLVIDIIIEQGWLQSIYGIHTFRIESIAHGKAAPVDELQILGVTNPALLRKVIVSEAAKAITDINKSLKLATVGAEREIMSRMTSLNESPTVLRSSPSKSSKMTGSPRYLSLKSSGSPRHLSLERRGVVSGEMLLHKIDEVSQSVKKIESMVEKSKAPSCRKQLNLDP